jgi:hypothetical protein
MIISELSPVFPECVHLLIESWSSFPLVRVYSKYLSFEMMYLLVLFQDTFSFEII